MCISRRWRFLTLISWLVIAESQFSIRALATPIPPQIEVHSKSASGVVSQPVSVALTIPSTTDSSTTQSAEEVQVASDSPTDDASSHDEPGRRALPAPLDGIFPGSEYLGPTPLIGVPDIDPISAHKGSLVRLSCTQEISNQGVWLGKSSYQCQYIEQAEHSGILCHSTEQS